MSGLKSISLPTRSIEAVPENTELPDWLLELSDTSPASGQPEAAVAEGVLPDWLAGLGGEEPAGAATSAEPPAPAELPDWLAGLGQEAAPPSPSPAQPTPPASPSSEPALPDWLSGLAGPDAGAAPSVLADWLSDQEEQTPAPSPTGQEADWLSGLVATEPEPTVATESEPTEESAPPDWLHELMSPEPSPAARQSAPPPALPLADPAEAAPLPDWLDDFGLTGSSAEEETDEQPDWLSDTGVGEPVDEELGGPDWLRSMDAVEPITEPAPDDWRVGLVGAGAPEGAEEEEEVLELDWTQGFSEAESTAEALPISPPLAFAELSEDAAPEAVRDDTIEIAPARPLPDWLVALADPDAAAPGSRSAEIPSWLLQYAVPGGPPASAGLLPLPNWLLINADAPPTRPSPTAPSGASSAGTPVVRREPTASEESSDWLAGLVPETEPEEVAEPDAFAEPVKPAAELPDWIAGLVEETEAEASAESPISGAVTEPAVELPDWIAGLVEETEAETVAELTTPDQLLEPVAELPDWLAGAVTEEDEDLTPPNTSIPEKAALPDWLANIVAEAEAEEDLPDWLAAGEQPEGGAATPPAADIFEQEPADAPDVTGRAPSTTAVFTEAPEMAEIPDWLQTVEPATPQAAPGKLAARRLQGVAPTDRSEEAELPDWLANIGEEESAATPAAPAFVPGALDGAMSRPVTREPEAAVESTEETPSWLDALIPAEAEEAPDIPEIPAGEDLARANVPTWLQQLRPSGTGPLPALPPEIAGILDKGSPAVDAASGLARAEIPEWVQQLRPTVTSAGEVVSEKYLGPAEESGPLAGLAGVIAPLLAVDIPENFAPIPLPQTPEVIVQQAQLWQQLLEQPRGKARPIAQQHGRPGLGAQLLRIAMALLLLVAAVVGLWWDGESLGQTPPPDARPGLGKLKAHVESLSPGDSVILALEYGPAEAVEMQPIVDTLLEQLAARQVNVIAVSTLPEGAGLIQALLTSHAMTNTLSSTESVYRVGAASGIADFLNRDVALEADRMLVVAARLEPLRGWIEQNAAARRPLPIGVCTNAAHGAFIMPYFETRDLNGWLVGLADLATYRQLLYQGEFAQLGTLDLTRVLNALLLTHWVAAGLLLCGLLYAVAAGKKGAK